MMRDQGRLLSKGQLPHPTASPMDNLAHKKWARAFMNGRRGLHTMYSDSHLEIGHSVDCSALTLLL